jgi:hypothetical protein
VPDRNEGTSYPYVPALKVYLVHSDIEDARHMPGNPTEFRLYSSQAREFLRQLDG